MTQWVENGDSTLFDNSTGLTWDRCVLGQTWSTALSACTGTPESLTWSGALLRANLAMFNGRAGWRVPNVKELESIVDRRCSSPALNPEFFRGNRETTTWSSTPGWAVNMADGSVVSGQAAATGMAVRLVRGGVKSAAFDVRVAAVPPVVVAGPAAVNDDVVSTQLLPTNVHQKLLLVTHGWNADTDAWPSALVKVLCAKLSVPVQRGALSLSQVGVTDYCSTPEWKIVALNWKAQALDVSAIDILAVFLPVVGLENLVKKAIPWHALSNGGHLGEKLGKALASNGLKYDFVHMIGHSAGANLLHEMGHQLRLANPSSPTIHATFLDPFCGYPDRCDYGYWSDWADSYIDSHEVIFLEGRETRMTLCNAAHFDVTKRYPAAQEGALSDVLSKAHHAWPYKCYVGSAIGSASVGSPFDVACLGSAANTVGFGLSYLGSNAIDPPALLTARSDRYNKGTLWTQGDDGLFTLQPNAKCGESTLQAVVGAVTSVVTGAISSVGNTIGPGVVALTSTCSTPTFAPPVNAGTTATLATCTLSGLKSASNATAAIENVTAWSSLSVNVGRRANRLRFSLQFTAPADGLLTVYFDDQQVYRTTHAVRGDVVYDTGFFNVPEMERGTHIVSFRLDALESSQAAAAVSAIQVGAAALCDLDVDGDGAMTVARDGALLLRYLMGFRGAALTGGLGLSDANAAQAIGDYVGSAVQFDVFGRPSSAPLATTDGLVLLRLMLGMSDDALLSGVAVPTGALFATSGAVRTNVNAKCGTRF